MNAVHKVIWSAVLLEGGVVSELTSSKGKQKRSSKYNIGCIAAIGAALLTPGVYATDYFDTIYGSVDLYDGDTIIFDSTSGIKGSSSGENITSSGV